MNSCPLFNSSRTQKIISLSSCEAELRARVSSASEGIYIRSVLEFALGAKVDHYIFTDSSSARQLVMKRRVGKVRQNFIDGKLPWIQPKRLQYDTSTNRQQHGRHQYQATWRTENQISDEPFLLLAQ